MVNMDLLGMAITQEWIYGWTFKLIQVILVLIIAKLISNGIRHASIFVDKRIYDIRDRTQKILVRVVNIFIYFFAFLAILNVLDLRNILVTAMAGAGVMGIAIGFAAKDVISNMLSGVFIGVDKPFKVGDIIEVKGVIGKITDIRFRSTTMESAEGKVMTIPNQIIAQDIVTNLTRKELRWVKIPVEIAYESNLKKALKILNRILIKHEEILENPEPEVIVTQFAESGINIEIRGWIRTKDLKKSRQIISEVSQEIKKEFDKNKIEIPYPKRVMISGKK